MNSSQSTSPKQICESILIEEKRYNSEHNILPSENAVADRLLARGVELADAYEELHSKLYAYPHALWTFLRLVLSTAAFWNPEKIDLATLLWTPDFIRQPFGSQSHWVTGS